MNTIYIPPERKKIPILVGGTGLYFKSLIDGLVKIPKISLKKRKSIINLQKKIGQKIFYQKLIQLDPKIKKIVNINDIQRSIRAYEVKKFTNKSFFDFLKETKSNFNKSVFRKLFIYTPKDLLQKRIENRVDKMFDDGAINEAKNFLKMISPPLLD